ncbi:type II toxin-antitoxin system HipA family toxin [Parasulfuritortus cantonensis]|uniref:Type II toxin-antitoxin system HipA family toxin n=1 Tax=Parasulfuritortus cantonensis TaxID=2528202 RepID=A0A4V2NVV3_9PROT|nr:HipA domain-containing protein [Parasulfuritortus cantonensis]TCJ14922.1 type II toxin-antitoxin system HipA family toxin [Parasulfuritortus cantonensis]
MSTRELVVWLDSVRVGNLYDEGSHWSFAYTAEWLSDPRGFDLSPGLKRADSPVVDGSNQRPVQWFFDNLLPEENARLALAKAANTDVADAWGLLAWLGAESAGALTLLPPGATTGAPGQVPLSDAELDRRIRDLPRQPLQMGAPKRMSLAGAQEKLAVILTGDQLYEPSGGRPSTHILKPNTTAYGYPHSAVNEWFCMQLAAALKLPVPETRLLHVPSAVYCVARFDRRIDPGSGETRRLHTLDGAQLLSLSGHYKYAENNLDSLLAIIGHCRAKVQTRRDLFRWLVFNVLIGNGDAHLKNLSFYLDAGGVRLAPHYDLVSTAIYSTPDLDPQPPHWPEVALSMPLGTAKQFAEIRRGEVLQAAETLAIPARLAAGYLDELLRHIPTRADAVLESYRVLEGIQGEMRHGEERTLRAIRHMAIAEMSRQLAA